jgi:hypothetical protein
MAGVLNAQAGRPRGTASEQEKTCRGFHQDFATEGEAEERAVLARGLHAFMRWSREYLFHDVCSGTFAYIDSTTLFLSMRRRQTLVLELSRKIFLNIDVLEHRMHVIVPQFCFV